MGFNLSTLMHGEMHSNPADLEGNSVALGVMPNGRPMPQGRAEEAASNDFTNGLQQHQNNNVGPGVSNLTHLNQSYVTADQHAVASNASPINLDTNHGHFRVNSNSSDINSSINHGTVSVVDNKARLGSTQNYGKIDVGNNHDQLSLGENHNSVVVGSNGGTMTSANTAQGGTEHVTENTGKINIDNSNGSHIIAHNKAGTIRVNELGPNGTVHIDKQEGRVVQTFDPQSSLGKKYPNGIAHEANGQAMTFNDKGHVNYWNGPAFIKQSPATATAAYGGTGLGVIVGGANLPGVAGGWVGLVNGAKTLHGS